MSQSAGASSAGSAQPAPAPRVRLETTLGAIDFELYAAHAPRTVDNFVRLVARGYYDGTPFHRIIAGFMAQGGDPSGTGRGGEAAWGAPFADELHRELHHTGAGVLSMANAGPNTNRSQFFITFAPAPHLDGRHTIFGRVAAGMAVVERLSRVPVGPDDRPREPVLVLRAALLPADAA